jgi:hypothetical protein
MRVANDQIHARQRCEFFGCALRVAACDNDSSFRVLAADSADCGTGILIGAVGNGAGIQDDYRSLLGIRGANKATLFELAFEGCAIRLGGATAKILNKKSRHALWYRTFRDSGREE